MSRWKCTAVIDNQALIFERYAENEEQVQIRRASCRE